MKLIEEKMEELISALNQDSRIIEVQHYKQKLLENKELIEKITKLQQLDIYSNEYKKLKIELFQNPDFIKFKHYENEVNFLIVQINHKLKSLIEKKGENHENH